MTTNGFDSRDPSFAAERTDLAWNRSGLALIACGAAVLRGIGRPPLHSGAPVVGALVLALGGFTWALGAWRARRARASGSARARASDLLSVSIGVAVVGVAAFVVGAFFPS